MILTWDQTSSGDLSGDNIAELAKSIVKGKNIDPGPGCDSHEFGVSSEVDATPETSCSTS